MNQNVAFAKNSCHTMQSNDIARTSDINFLDSKSLIINFLVQDFESYVVQTRVNADCLNELFAVRSFLILPIQFVLPCL